jgi:hypothetical protein
MYLKQILDRIGNAVNDTTLKSAGTNADRTKEWVQDYYHLELLPKRQWGFLYNTGTLSLTASTRRYNLPRWVRNPNEIRIQDAKQAMEVDTSQDSHRPNTWKSITTPPSRQKYQVASPQDQEQEQPIRLERLVELLDQKLLTGSGTAWQSSDLAQYDTITVGSYVYTIDSIGSDTSITLFEDLVSDVLLERATRER